MMIIIITASPTDTIMAERMMTTTGMIAGTVTKRETGMAETGIVTVNNGLANPSGTGTTIDPKRGTHMEIRIPTSHNTVRRQRAIPTLPVLILSTVST